MIKLPGYIYQGWLTTQCCDAITDPVFKTFWILQILSEPLGVRIDSRKCRCIVHKYSWRIQAWDNIQDGIGIWEIRSSKANYAKQLFRIYHSSQHYLNQKLLNYSKEKGKELTCPASFLPSKQSMLFINTEFIEFLALPSSFRTVFCLLKLRAACAKCISKHLCVSDLKIFKCLFPQIHSMGIFTLPGNMFIGKQQYHWAFKDFSFPVASREGIDRAERWSGVPDPIKLQELQQPVAWGWSWGELRTWAIGGS